VVRSIYDSIVELTGPDLMIRCARIGNPQAADAYATADLAAGEAVIAALRAGSCRDTVRADIAAARASARLRWFVSDGSTDLEIETVGEPDWDSRFEALDLESGERIWVNGWLMTDREELP